MIEIVQAQLEGGSLIDSNDLVDVSSIILRHLRVEPEFLRTAPHTQEGVTEWFGRKHLDSFWFARSDTVGVGMVGLSRHSYHNPNIDYSYNVEICRLMVVPEFRGQGIGRKLFYTALDACETERPWLTVLVDSSAEKMYKDWGWKQLGSVPSQDDPKDNVIAMHLP